MPADPGSQQPRAAQLPRLARIGRAYAAVAIHTFNVLLLFVGVNVACLIFLAVRPPPPRRNPASFPPDKLHQAYADMPMDVVLGTLEENWVRLRYEAKPWAHYGEAEFTGRYVNVRKDGTRSNGPPKGQPSSGKPFRVIAFGGSTTWGYGVPDWESIPAHLERALQARHPDRAVEVVNHGHCFYWTAQELALLQSLLRRGEHADAIVFLDGLNEAAAPFSTGDDPRFDEPASMDELRTEFARQYAPPDVLPAWLPLVQVVRRVRDRAVRTRALAVAAGRDTDAWAAQGDGDAETILRMYLQNQRAAADAAGAAGIAAYFFWQPIPLYAYDTKKLLFDPGGEARHRFAIQALYEKVEERKPPRLTNLSRVVETYEKPAYVDLHHYSPDVCKMVAERMADAIVVPD